MSSSWTRIFGFSMIVCLVALLAAPAMAAGPFHGRITSPVSRGIGAGVLGHGMNIFSSLQVMAFPVVGPLAVVMEAKNVIQRFINPSSRGMTGAFTGNYRPGRSPWALRRTTLSVYPASRGAAGTMGIGFAENLTGYLRGKGYNVSDLNAALSNVKADLASSNLTALGSSMRTFQSDLNAKIAAGTMNRTVIQDYLKTMPAGNWGFRAGREPAGGMGAHRMGARWEHMRRGSFSRSPYSHSIGGTWRAR